MAEEAKGSGASKRCGGSGKSNSGLLLIGPMVLTEKDNSNKGGCLVILILRLPGNQLVWNLRSGVYLRAAVDFKQ